MKWTIIKKKRTQAFLLVLLIGAIGIGINHYFFKNMQFIQSKVYPNLYLVKYPSKDNALLEKTIQEKINEHLKTQHKTGKPLTYTNENGVYFYEYGGLTFGFIGKAGTGYFVDHEEDRGGFVSEELGMYQDYRLAEFYYDPCPKDTNLYCGEINYFKEGDFFKMDSLTNLVSIKNRGNQKITLQKQAQQDTILPIHGVLDKDVLSKYYPGVIENEGEIGDVYAEKVALPTKNEALVTLLRYTVDHQDVYLCTHTTNLDLIDAFYIGEAKDFDNNKSVTINHKILQDSTVVFNKVVWGMVNQNQEKVIDTLAHETTTLKVTAKGGVGYNISKSTKHFTLEVFLIDSDPNGTHLRDAPKGNIVYTLDPIDEYILSVVKGENGWFRVLAIEGVESGEIAIPTGHPWVHSSVIGMRTNKDISVLDAFKSGKKNGVILRDKDVRILELHEDWVKIEYQGVRGWAAAEMLCGNPVTTCP